MKAMRWVVVALVIMMLGGCFIITDGPTASPPGGQYFGFHDLLLLFLHLSRCERGLGT